MQKQLVIFGIGKIAEVVYYYAKEECGFSIACFCVDEKYRTIPTFQDLPVVAFEEVAKNYPPDRYDMFVAVGYHDLNRLRETKCREAMEKGYALASIISPRANLPLNVTTGWNCFIMPPAVIHPCVRIANNVFIWSGAMVGHHSVIEDNCWLTSCCNISGNVHIGANTFLAVNATVGHSVTLGKNCFLGANTLVIKNLEDDKVVIAEAQKPLRLTSNQFLRMSNFSSL
ncbi:transferase [Niastella caeni]|uniref:Transferase n=1 Tax=Niastella caeni TaxID=2569763 RepID=A0A4S8I0K3_9BACT|nr:NeuD/PglB/VioB family sugar acetyltransferase [Niastella caeni]THU41537.1 transferase [Niastella caeni]